MSGAPHGKRIADNREGIEALIKIPPFRDSHIHFSIDGKTVGIDGLEEIKRRLLERGIGQVIDMGHRSGIGFAARLRWKGAISVVTSGSALYRAGGYGSFIGAPVSGREEIGNAVDQAAAKGADFIKAVNSGIVLSQGGAKVSAGGFDAGELALIVSRARGKGLGVACHANSDKAVREAIEAGVSTIEHGFFLSRETIGLMAERDVAWTPTANALLSITAFIPEEERAYIEDVVERHCEMIGYAGAAGVRLNVGSDAGSKGIEHGSAFFAELGMFRKAGLSMERILASACMDESEMERGNFLVVTEDFIERETIEEIHITDEKEEGTCLM